MLSAVDDVTLGLIVAEGIETSIALYMREPRPVWALGGAGNLKKFPVLSGLERLTIAADADERGLAAAKEVQVRWLSRGREAQSSRLQPETGPMLKYDAKAAHEAAWNKRRLERLKVAQEEAEDSTAEKNPNGHDTL